MVDIHPYLKRIGVPAAEACSVPSLRSLVRAHLEQVPFENLDILAGRGPVSLKEEDLFEKVVRRGRGGYCFELNKLFFLLLQGLGYETYPACARIVYRRSDPRPWSHRVSIVKLEGKKWLCDVGYGGPGPKGLVCLSERGVQDVAGELFSVEERDGFTTLCRHDPDGVHPMIVFRDEPCFEIDFDVMSAYFSAHPDAVFTQKTILHRCIPDGQISLVGDIFTLREKGAETRREADAAERRRLIREAFGIPYFEKAEETT